MKVQHIACLFVFCPIVSKTVQGLQPSRLLIQKHHQHLDARLSPASTIKTINEARTQDTTTKFDSQKRNNFLTSSWFAAACFFATCTFSWWQPDPVLAAPTSTAPVDDAWTKNFASSLRPPSEDTPQIPLPVITNRDNGESQGSLPPGIMGVKKSPSTSVAPPVPWQVQALVSLQNARIERPFANDFMVVQVLKERPPKEPYVVSEDTKQNVLGGAKIQVGKTRFPSSISLGPENAKSPDLWKELSSKQDLWLETTICKEDSVKFPCAPEEQRYRGVALSKLFDGLPVSDDLKEGTPTVIRLPAALLLERVNDGES